MLDEAAEPGALLVASGRPFFGPTVVVDRSRKNEEIFARITPLLEDEAWSAAVNGAEYGLVDALVTGDVSRGMRLDQHLPPGAVHVNDSTPQDRALGPSGGIWQSWLGGRPGGICNIEESTERRSTTINSKSPTTRVIAQLW